MKLLPVRLKVLISIDEAFRGDMVESTNTTVPLQPLHAVIDLCYLNPSDAMCRISSDQQTAANGHFSNGAR